MMNSRGIYGKIRVNEREGETPSHTATGYVSTRTACIACSVRAEKNYMDIRTLRIADNFLSDC